MNKLEKINAMVKKKQIGRAIGAAACVFGFSFLMSRFFYQKGITECQRALAKFYPEEYALLTAKVLETVEQK